MFSLVHKKTSNSVNNKPLTNSPKPMIFQFKQSIAAPQRLYQQPQPKPSPAILTDAITQPKMKWGRPIWTFFHVTAQKLKPESFNIIIKEYLNFILLVCNTLPCPVCSSHASEYLRSINLNNIKTKEDLINLFFTFHNSVNLRKGFQVLSREQAPAYENANTIMAVKMFVSAFEDKTRSVKLMADDLVRMRIVEKFKNWINANIQHFDP
jgi:hypothetical protein